MIAKRNGADDVLGGQGKDLVVWGPKYETGIGHIDRQHRELVSLTNELYRACLTGNEAAGTAFKESMSRMVEYVRFHFGSEQELLERIEYPRLREHKKQHEELIKSILEAVKAHREGEKFVPNHFVRTLKDWIFGHICIADKSYAAYAADLKKKGLLPVFPDA